MAMYLYDRFVNMNEDEKMVRNTITFLTKEIIKNKSKTAIIPFGKDGLYYYGIVLKCAESGQVFGKVSLLSMTENNDNNYFAWKFPSVNGQKIETEKMIFDGVEYYQVNIQSLLDKAKEFTNLYMKHINSDWEYEENSDNTLDLHIG